MRERKRILNMLVFGACAAVSGIAAAVGGLSLAGAETVLAAENDGEEMVVSNVDADDGADAGVNATGELSENALNTGVDKNLGVYDFKDNKTTGTVTVTKVWDDDKTNEEREIPDIKISTAKPSKSTLGYTVTFHGDKDAGLVFDDGSDVNEVVYNSSGQIVDGVFKMPVGVAAGAVSWFTDEALTNKVDVNEDGTVQMALSGDVDLWGRMKTFEIKGFQYDVKNNNEFNASIPDTVTEIFFTDEIKPAEAEIIDVDGDGDGGVVAWTENNGMVMKVSTQIKGIKVQAAKNSKNMLFGCSGLTVLDLSPFNTQKVTSMSDMFYNCSRLTTLTTGTNFKFVGTNYELSGTWQNTSGETFNGDYNTANFPSNVADTYTKISS